MMRATRRRFIAISAAAGGLPVLPIRPVGAAPLLRTWSGAALGADATVQIHHPDAAVADRLIAESLAEVSRLERVLSLYHPTARCPASTATVFSTNLHSTWSVSWPTADVTVLSPAERST